MDIRPFFENWPEVKIVTRFKTLGTGISHLNKWKVLYSDGTVNDDDTDENIRKKSRKEYRNFCIHFRSRKFHGTAGGANRVSLLAKWPHLIKVNAPKIQYMQHG